MRFRPWIRHSMNPMACWLLAVTCRQIGFCMPIGMAFSRGTTTANPFFGGHLTRVVSCDRKSFMLAKDLGVHSNLPG